MKTFDLQACTSQVYAQFPAAQWRPVIGITGNYEELTCKLGRGYYDSIIRAGGIPVIIPPSADSNVLMGTLDRIDALLLSGGADINPLWCGEEPVPGLHGINQERDLPELLITRLAYNRQMPILGICRGIQTLAAALSGKVCQDISATVKHSQDADRSEPTHSVTVKEDSTLYNIYKTVLSPLSSLLSYTSTPSITRLLASRATSSALRQRHPTASSRLLRVRSTKASSACSGIRSAWATTDSRCSAGLWLKPLPTVRPSNSTTAC